MCLHENEAFLRKSNIHERFQWKRNATAFDLATPGNMKLSAFSFYNNTSLFLSSSFEKSSYPPFRIFT